MKHSYSPYKNLREVSPPGWSGTTKAMKKHKEIDNPYALSWYMKNKGDTPHYAPEKKESYSPYSKIESSLMADLFHRNPKGYRPEKHYMRGDRVQCPACKGSDPSCDHCGGLGFVHANLKNAKGQADNHATHESYDGANSTSVMAATLMSHGFAPYGPSNDGYGFVYHHNDLGSAVLNDMNQVRLSGQQFDSPDSLGRYLKDIKGNDAQRSRNVSWEKNYPSRVGQFPSSPDAHGPVAAHGQPSNEYESVREGSDASHLKNKTSHVYHKVLTKNGYGHTQSSLDPKGDIHIYHHTVIPGHSVRVHEGPNGRVEAEHYERNMGKPVPTVSRYTSHLGLDQHLKKVHGVRESNFLTTNPKKLISEKWDSDRGAKKKARSKRYEGWSPEELRAERERLKKIG